jgi:hypothetical protein
MCRSLMSITVCDERVSLFTQLEGARCLYGQVSVTADNAVRVCNRTPASGLWLVHSRLQTEPLLQAAVVPSAF